MATRRNDAISDTAVASSDHLRSGNAYHADNYFTVGRFLTFYEQLRALRCLPNAKTVAEIGVGSGATAALMRNMKYEVTTIDVDSNLKPNVVSSVLELQQNISNSFDVVVCFEVLEHLPFVDFDSALHNIVSITRRNVIISLPYAGYTVRLSGSLSKLGERQVTMAYRLPLFWSRHEYDGQHYWEVGKRGFSLRRITEAIGKHVRIRRRWLFPYNQSQVFFLCDVPELEQAKREAAGTCSARDA